MALLRNSFYLNALHVSTPWTLPQRLGGTVMPLLAMFACSNYLKYSLNTKKRWSHELLTITQITTTMPKEGSPGGWESQSHCHNELPTEHFFQIHSLQVPAKSKTGGGLPWDQIVVGPIAIFQPKTESALWSQKFISFNFFSASICIFILVMTKWLDAKSSN